MAYGIEYSILRDFQGSGEFGTTASESWKRHVSEGLCSAGGDYSLATSGQFSIDEFIAGYMKEHKSFYFNASKELKEVKKLSIEFDTKIGMLEHEISAMRSANADMKLKIENIEMHLSETGLADLVFLV